MNPVMAVLVGLVCTQAAAQSDASATSSSATGSSPVPAYRPLTNQERWREYTKDTFGPGALFRAAGPALGDHLANRPEEWGQGAGGYFPRVASRFGRFTAQESIEHSLAFALRQDVRYERCRCSGFFRRAGNAVAQNFVTRNEHGNWTFASARAAGYFGGEFAGLAWMPASSTPSDALAAGGRRYALGAGFNMIREFWPEISRPFRRR